MTELLLNLPHKIAKRVFGAYIGLNLGKDWM